MENKTIQVKKKTWERLSKYKTDFEKDFEGIIAGMLNLIQKYKLNEDLKIIMKGG